MEKNCRRCGALKLWPYVFCERGAELERVIQRGCPRYVPAYKCPVDRVKPLYKKKGA